MDQLPIAILIPHSGLVIPPEIESRINLTPEQIFNDADAYTDLIYGYKERVYQWLSFPYSRALIDVNRSTDMRSLNRPGDGIVKRQAGYGVPVYQADAEPDADLENHLIDTYWRPWHDELAQIAANPEIKLVLDCHSMAGASPSTFADAGAIRPRITASNLGDENGNAPSGDVYLTASAELTRFAGEQLGAALRDIPELAPSGEEFAINTPYRGGYNIAEHGGKTQPWIMIELSRALYIGKQTGDSPIVPPDSERLGLLRERIWQAIEATLNFVQQS